MASDTRIQLRSRYTFAACSLIVSLLAALIVTSLFPQPLLAATPAPVQVYYVPFPEDHVLTALQTIYPGPPACAVTGVPTVTDPVVNYIAISVISAGTIIYYDHWEDGFEADISNPTQSSTEIWGDGDPSNGAPPGVPTDVIAANTVIILDNTVLSTTRQQVVDYDGGDKFAATRPIAVTRAAWATGSETLLAGALEVYPTYKWGTRYTAPAGIDLAYNDIFGYSGLTIMAKEDNTTIEIDLDNDGIVDVTTLLDQGQGYQVNGGIQVGTVVSASAPIQTSLITGKLCEYYESRWYVLFPDEQWGNSYYSPVSTPAEHATTAFVYNPDDSPLTVQWRTAGILQPDLNLPAGGTAFALLPEGSGAHFFTPDGRPFAALAAIDSVGAVTRDYDWGFTLVPESQLTAQSLIGWGAGRDPRSAVNPNENGSPIWVTAVLPEDAVDPVTICIDFEGDEQGPLTDAFGFQYDLEISLGNLENQRVFNPTAGGDQTGTIIYICDANIPNAKLAVAWGPDPSTATATTPGLDLGTTAPPASSFAASKSAEVGHDADGDDEASPGDMLLYTVVVANSSRVPVPNVRISDTVPLNTQYIADSTNFDDGVTVVALPDDLSGTPFPLDEGGILLGELPVRGLFTVTFQVLIDDPFPVDVDRVRNVAVVSAIGEEIPVEVETPVDLDPELTLQKFTNGIDADEPPGPLVDVGDPITWTYVLTNSGQLTLTNVVVTDSHEITLVYVMGDVDDDGILYPGESWTYVATGTAQIGQYANVGMATATTKANETVHATDLSHYFGVLTPAIQLIKTPSASAVWAGTVVTYTYTVSNSGNDPLSDVSLSDDRCAPLEFVDGDDGDDGILGLAESWIYLCAAVITESTTNIAVVTALDSTSQPISATATAHVEVPHLYLPIIFTPVLYVPCPPPGGCPIDGLDETKALAVHRGKDRIYIISRNGDRLLAVDAKSNEVVATGETGAQPWGLVVNETTGRVYVSNYASGDVWIYDDETLDVVAKVPVGSNPALMAIIPGLDTVFVLVRAGSRVAIVQGLSLVDDISAGGSGPFGIAADPLEGTVYISHRDSLSLSLLRYQNGAWNAQGGPQFIDQRQLFGVAFNPLNRKLYSLYAAADSNWRLDIWEPNEASPWGLRATLSIPSSGDPASAAVGGLGIAVNVATGNLFIANTGANSLTVVDGDSDAIVATVALGNEPFAVATDDSRNKVYIGLREPGRLIKLDDNY